MGEQADPRVSSVSGTKNDGSGPGSKVRATESEHQPYDVWLKRIQSFAVNLVLAWAFGPTLRLDGVYNRTDVFTLPTPIDLQFDYPIGLKATPTMPPRTLAKSRCIATKGSKSGRTKCGGEKVSATKAGGKSTARAELSSSTARH